MKPKRKFVGLLDVLARERLGLIHLLFVHQIDQFAPAWLGLGHKVEEDMPELKRIANVFMRDVGTVMAAPLQRDFRKGLLPGEEKPLPMEKQFAALLLATRGRRESFKAVVQFWHLLVFLTLQRSIPKENLKSLLADFVHARRGKVLRKWMREERFKALVRKFQSGYIESLLNLMQYAIFHAPDRPLLEVSREIYRIGRIMATMEKSVPRLFVERAVQRLQSRDKERTDALVLAVVYALEPYSAGLAKETWNSLRNKIVTESFLLQKNTMKAITVERSKTKRAEAAASLEPLVRIVQIVLMNAIGMIDHEAYTDKVIADVEEELRKRMRKKAKKKK